MLYGYARGRNFTSGQRMHLAGVGDFSVRSILQSVNGWMDGWVDDWMELASPVWAVAFSRGACLTPPGLVSPAPACEDPRPPLQLTACL